MQSLSEHKLLAEIEPIPVLVKREYLENFEGGQGTYVNGTLQAVWAYPGHQPTFTVLLEDGTVFSYLPASAFTHTPLSCHQNIGAKEACSVYAPSDRFVLYKMKMLEQHTVLCYSREKLYLGVGRYHFSMEWPYENEVVHLFCVNNGAYHFVPNHKMLLLPQEPKKQIPSLPTWKKLREEWVK